MIVLSNIVSATLYATAAWENPIGGGAPYTATPEVHGIFGALNIVASDLSPGFRLPLFTSGITGSAPFGSTTRSLSIDPTDFANLSTLSVAVFPMTGGTNSFTIDTRVKLTDCSLVITYADGTVVTARPQSMYNRTTPPNGGTIQLSGLFSPTTGLPQPYSFIERIIYGGIPNVTYTQFYNFGIPDSPTPDWLIINEPGLGMTNRTSYLSKVDGAQHSFTQQLRQRGQATIQLYVAAGDSYAPTRGAPVYLFDQVKPSLTIPTGWKLVFSGLIQDIENQWIGRAGDRFVIVTAVSLESVFDTVYATPYQYVNQTCGFIVRDLLSRFERNCPVTAPLALDPVYNIANGPVIPLLVTNYEKLSDLFDQLATSAQFTWGVVPSQAVLYFQSPFTIPAPFTLQSANILWDGVNWKQSGADYRNRQAVRLSYDAFAHSCEFFTGAGQTAITLSRPVQQVTNAYATLSTCNTATGTFSGVPFPGDTITIQVPTGTWLAAHIYALAGVLVDANGYVQKVTTAGTSAGSGPPAFSDVTTGTTIDGTVIWTCQGPAGLSTGTQTYTAVLQAPPGEWAALQPNALPGAIINSGGYAQQMTIAGTTGATRPSFSNILGSAVTDGSATWTCLGPCLDNSQFGQFVIGFDNTTCCQNLAWAINATVADAGGNPLRGVDYSLPTWENGLCNAINVVSGAFTLQQKHAGTGWLSALSTSSGVTATWQQSHAYGLLATIASGGFVQQVTTAGVSGGPSPPTFSTTTGITTADGSVTWTCLGPVANFAWSSPSTSGGTSPQGSLGPNEGATISLQVYVAGTSVAAPGLAYTPGSASLTLATPLNVGSNLNVEYTRSDGNIIEVENTQLITDLAVITHGTGKYQQITDASSQGFIATSAAAGLLVAQGALAAYSVIPQTFSFPLYDAGLTPGQALTISLTLPNGSTILLNGIWVIEEISAELVPVWHGGATPWMPGFGHYKYTARCVNIQEIGSYLDFWEGLGGGGAGGSGGGGALVATSGGGLTPQSTALAVDKAGTLVGTEGALNFIDGANITTTVADNTGAGRIDATIAVTGVIPVARGGTGQSAYTDGQLLIGDTSTGGLDKASLTAGTGIAITPGHGSISIASTVVGTVTSVGLSLPSILTVTVTPVTTTGTLTAVLATQSANTIFAGPTTGSAAAPTFRAIVAADLPLGSSSAFGAVKVDNTTVTAAAGVISIGQAVATTNSPAFAAMTLGTNTATGPLETYNAALGNAYAAYQAAGVTKWSVGLDGSNNFNWFNNVASLAEMTLTPGGGLTLVGGLTAASLTPGIIVGSNAATGPLLIFDATTGGNCYNRYQENGVTKWSVGLDASDNFNWFYNPSSAAMMVISTTGVLNVVGGYKINGTAGFTGAVAGRSAQNGLVI